MRARARIQQFDDALVLQLGGRLAAVADQERHRVLRRARVVAADVGVDRRQLVDEAVLEQEIQRAVHRRRRRGVVRGLHLVEQFVGLDRPAGIGDQAQRVARGSASAAGRAARTPLHLAARRHRRRGRGASDRCRRGVGFHRRLIIGPGRQLVQGRRRCVASASRLARPGRRCGAMSGLTWVPVIATRSGWATLPMPRPSASAVSCSATPTALGRPRRQRGQALARIGQRRLRGGTEVLGHRGLVVLLAAAGTRPPRARPFPSASARGRAARPRRRPAPARWRGRSPRCAGAIPGAWRRRPDRRSSGIAG